MSQSLSPEAVAALVEAAKDGQLPDATTAPARSSPRARSVDLNRPTKFTAEQERKLRRALETFSRTAGTRLSAELRVPVELEVIQVSQLTWSNAHAQLSPQAICAVLLCEPIGTRMLMGAEVALVLTAIERLLGNTSGQVPRARRMTDIDWALAHRLFGSFVDQLSAIWQELAELELSLVELDARAASAQLAPVNEPTLSLTMEVRLDRVSATIALLVPWRSISQVVQHFSEVEGFDQDDDDGSGDAVQAAMGTIEVQLRAEVGAVELTVEDVLALAPGDVVHLRSPAGVVTLCSGRVPVHHGTPGRSGVRRAVQIVGPVGGSPA